MVEKFCGMGGMFGGGGGGGGPFTQAGICFDFQKGQCDRGDSCRCAHVEGAPWCAPVTPKAASTFAASRA